MAAASPRAWATARQRDGERHHPSREARPAPVNPMTDERGREDTRERTDRVIQRGVSHLLHTRWLRHLRALLSKRGNVEG